MADPFDAQRTTLSPDGAGGQSVSSALAARIAADIADSGGWWPFDRFMAAALYTPGLGYYARGATVFGTMPGDGSDFVTAPELSPLFAQTLAVQVRQALQATQTHEVWEFGAGSGALAAGLLNALGEDCVRYHIVELSSALRERQRERLAAHGERVCWHTAWPEALSGVVVGNEVLDAMPVQLLHWDGAQWFERGVAVASNGAAATAPFIWADRPTTHTPPHPGPYVPGTVVETHAQALGFIASLGERLHQGAAFFIDYGFPRAEYYHPQRAQGTLMCHRAHRADAEPLHDVGEKDITAHVDFTGLALAAQDAGLTLLGYTSQGRFLLNCGLTQHLERASLIERAMAARLVNEHEMGELFKVIAFARGPWFDALGFSQGDRLHRL